MTSSSVTFWRAAPRVAALLACVACGSTTEPPVLSPGTFVYTTNTQGHLTSTTGAASFSLQASGPDTTAVVQLNVGSSSFLDVGFTNAGPPAPGSYTFSGTASGQAYASTSNFSSDSIFPTPYLSDSASSLQVTSVSASQVQGTFTLVFTNASDTVVVAKILGRFSATPSP